MKVKVCSAIFTGFLCLCIYKAQISGERLQDQFVLWFVHIGIFFFQFIFIFFLSLLFYCSYIYDILHGFSNKDIVSCI